MWYVKTNNTRIVTWVHYLEWQYVFRL